MISQREILFSTLLLGLLIASTFWLFRQVVDQESLGSKASLQLPAEPSVWVLRSGNKCFGSLRLQFNEGEISWLELVGEFRLRSGATMLPVNLKGFWFFNQLGQMFSGSLKLKADLYSFTAELREINPFRIAVDVIGAPEPVHYETQFQGPVVLSRSTSQLSITSPHRIRQRRELANLIPASWPVSVNYYPQAAAGGLDCNDADFFFDLSLIMPFMRDVVPGLAIFPDKIFQSYQDGHA